MKREPIDYLNPGVAPGLPRVTMPVVQATNDALKGYGFPVDARTTPASRTA